MSGIRIERNIVCPQVHVGPGLLLDPSDGRSVKELLPDGITAEKIQVVSLDGRTYHTVIGPKPGDGENWAVSVSKETANSLLGGS